MQANENEPEDFAPNVQQLKAKHRFEAKWRLRAVLPATTACGERGEARVLTDAVDYVPIVQYIVRQRRHLNMTNPECSNVVHILPVFHPYSGLYPKFYFGTLSAHSVLVYRLFSGISLSKNWAPSAKFKGKTIGQIHGQMIHEPINQSSYGPFPVISTKSPRLWCM